MDEQTEKINMVELSDTELDALNQIVRSYKITATGQEILMIKFNKQGSPILDAITKVVVAWEQRAQEVKAEQEASASAKASVDSKIISLQSLSTPVASDTEQN